MTRRTERRIEELLSREIDGDLTDRDRALLERLLRAHPEAERLREELQGVSRLVHALPRPERRATTWNGISEAIGKHRASEESQPLLPRRWMPAVVTLSAVTVLSLGAFAVIRFDAIIAALTDTTDRVQTAYESGIKGWIMPLFETTDNDRMLTFAVFGTLPLDADSTSILRVDDRSADGYHIDVAPTAGSHARSESTALRLEDVFREVQASELQRRKVDTLLAAARSRIEASVLVSPDEGLAIDPRLAQYHQTMLASLASVFEPGQRERLARLLDERGSPFVSRVLTEAASPEGDALITESIEGSAPRAFVLVPVGTAVPARRVLINRDSVRSRMRMAVLEEEAVTVRIEEVTRRVLEDLRTNTERPVQERREMERAIRSAREAYEEAARVRRTAASPGESAPVTSAVSDDVYFFRNEEGAVTVRIAPVPPAHPAAPAPAARERTVIVRVRERAVRPATPPPSPDVRIGISPGIRPTIQIEMDSAVRNSIREAMRQIDRLQQMEHLDEHERRELQEDLRELEKLRGGREIEDIGIDLREFTAPPRPPSVPVVPNDTTMRDSGGIRTVPGSANRPRRRDPGVRILRQYQGRPSDSTATR